MRLRVVDTAPSPRRVSVHQAIYDRLAQLDSEKWLEITCESDDVYHKVLQSLRGHRRPKVRCRAAGQRVILAQEER